MLEQLEQWDDVLLYREDMAIPSGAIRWNETYGSVDLFCVCGYSGGYDGYDLYFWKCPSCQACYAVGQCIRLILLSPEQTAMVEKLSDFKACNDENC